MAEKTIQDKINELYVFLEAQQEDFTVKIMRDRIMPTKEELELQKALKKQYDMMVKMNNSIKKVNKVGSMNTAEFDNLLTKIKEEKGTIGDIVRDTKM